MRHRKPENFLSGIVRNGHGILEEERLTAAERADEALVMGLRLSEGIDAGAVADRLRLGLVPARKPGKLPYSTVSESYDLEYGVNTLELHTDAVQPGERVVIVDDLLATGGTVKAASRLVEVLGGSVAGLAFVVELGFLNGRARLDGYETMSLVTFD
jgi:adenine phosphoribosyltransferase